MFLKFLGGGFGDYNHFHKGAIYVNVQRAYHYFCMNKCLKRFSILISNTGNIEKCSPREENVLGP